MLIAQSNYRICAAIFLNYRSSLSDGSHWGEWWFLKQGTHLLSHCNMFNLSACFLHNFLFVCIVSMQCTLLSVACPRENKVLVAPQVQQLNPRDPRKTEIFKRVGVVRIFLLGIHFDLYQSRIKSFFFR